MRGNKRRISNNGCASYTRTSLTTRPSPEEQTRNHRVLQAPRTAIEFRTPGALLRPSRSPLLRELLPTTCPSYDLMPTSLSIDTVAVYELSTPIQPTIASDRMPSRLTPAPTRSDAYRPRVVSHHTSFGKDSCNHEMAAQYSCSCCWASFGIQPWVTYNRSSIVFFTLKHQLCCRVASLALLAHLLRRIQVKAGISYF
jgi:hypothetical protein